MSVDFEKIPDCVWDWFDYLLNPENKDRRAGVKRYPSGNALLIAWGWRPALLQPRQETLLSRYGLAAYAWHLEHLSAKAEPKEEVPLLERALAVLTPNQGRIFEYLCHKRTAGYDALTTIPKAWRDVPSDEAINKALKDMKARLEAANLRIGYIGISPAKRRVTLEKDK